MTENTNTKNVRGIASAPRNGSILNLNLQCKQTIVDLIQDVVNGKVSMRRAATEIQKHVPKKRLTAMSAKW